MSLTDRSVVPLPAKQVPIWVQSTRTAVYLNLVLATLVAYDTACTFDKEVKYLWRKKLSVTSFVFFLNRYGGMFGPIAAIIDYIPVNSLTECNLAQWGRSISYWVTIVSIDYLLMIRVLALYHNERKLSIILGTLLCMEAVTKLVWSSLTIVSQQVLVADVGGYYLACAAGFAAKPYSYLINWLIPLIYGSMLLILALIRATDHWKMNGMRGSQLVLVVITDQVLYFALVILSSVFNVLDNKFEMKPVLNQVLDGLGSPTLLCIFGSRIFFNLIEAAEHGVNTGTNWSSYSHSAIEFEKGPDKTDFQSGTENNNSEMHGKSATKVDLYDSPPLTHV